MIIEIDADAGFCNGVVRAIKKAEETLEKDQTLYCLGDIVHNEEEIARLQKKGLYTITSEDFFQGKYSKVLIRAHGEPPENYRFAKTHGIVLIDATCPIVIRLQQSVKQAWREVEKIDGQIVIFGEKNHAEIIGLNGQIDNRAIIVENPNDLTDIDFSKPLRLFSQTTQNAEDYQKLIQKIMEQMQTFNNTNIVVNNTICAFVSKRSENLSFFSKQYDLVIFVSGRKSSNGKYLYEICKANNPNSYFITSATDLQKAWFNNISSVGITGATSTPQWLMRNIADVIAQQ